eukprot:1261786-Rhodomonas_salina.5
MVASARKARGSGWAEDAEGEQGSWKLDASQRATRRCEPRPGRRVRTGCVRAHSRRRPLPEASRSCRARPSARGPTAHPQSVTSLLRGVSLQNEGSRLFNVKGRLFSRPGSERLETVPLNHTTRETAESKLEHRPSAYLQGSCVEEFCAADIALDRVQERCL